MSPQDKLCINSIRALAIDAIEKANSGHPGLPLGAAPTAYALFQEHLNFDPAAPDWPNRDRFILSAGHGSMLQYALLHLYGYELTIDDLKNFRQWGSRTPGHPEHGETAGVEATTGPLGQGTANSVGMAVAERWMAARWNRPGHEIIDHRTYALVSDGDLMEGIAYEAASIAGKLGLAKLTWLYDANDVSLDGPTSLTFDHEDIRQRFQAQGWQVLAVADGDSDLDGIHGALRSARDDRERPSLIIVKTTIGYGSPDKAGKADAHGSPLGAEEAAATKKALGWESAAFEIPREAREHFAARSLSGAETRGRWVEAMAAYRKAFPAEAAELDDAMAGRLPQGWDEAIPHWPVGEKLATRAAGGKVLNHFAARVPWLVGGDADLSVSTKTALAEAESMTAQSPGGRNIHFGVREHGMGGIANGMAYHGGVRPFTATFFVFSDYMRGSVRLAALAGLPVTFVFTHDSVSVGEDGPTHEPIEHLMSLRAMPGLQVIRPADANETAAAWACALERTNGPTALVLSRQGLPVLDIPRSSVLEGVRRGAYVAADSEGFRLILLATGSEVSVAFAAREALETAGIPTRVVSMPCWERFSAQDAAYRESVLPASVAARVSIEAGATLGWERWVGAAGRCIGIDRFGASAPGDEVLEKLGIRADVVVEVARGLV